MPPSGIVVGVVGVAGSSPVSSQEGLLQSGPAAPRCRGPPGSRRAAPGGRRPSRCRSARPPRLPVHPRDARQGGERPRSGRRAASRDRAPADHGLDLGRRSVGHDPARGHQHDAVGVARRPPRGSGWRRRPSCPRGEPAHRSPRSRGGPRRPSPPWARRAPAGRVGDQRDGEADALGLAARQLLGAPVRDLGGTGESEHVVDVEGSGYSDATMRQSSRTLRSRMSPPIWSMAPTIPAATASAGGAAEQRHPAPVGRGQAEHHVDGGGLAGAVRPEQRDRLAGRDREVDVAHGADRSGGSAERLLELPEGDAASGGSVVVVMDPGSRDPLRGGRAAARDRP